ncbi:MAG: hypothetical protein J6A52_07795 [Bacilli bacterium]|nr:hypothetical protein [Bacilli bacterium]
MKFSIIDDNNFSIYANNKYLKDNKEKEEELYETLKKVLISIRKKYAFDIYGFYEVNIYSIENIGTLLNFYRKDDDNFIYKTIDLKIIKNPSEDVYLKFADYYIIEKYKNIRYKEGFYYLKAKDIKKDDVLKLIEFFEIIIDDSLKVISYI